MAVNGATKDLALSYQARQARRARQVADQIQDLWRSLKRRDLTASFQGGIGAQMVTAVTAGQLASVWDTDDYVDSIAVAEGAGLDRVGRINPSAFVGLAADGRDLDSLMYLPIITTKQSIAAGMNDSDAMLTGLQQAIRLSSSEVMQAGRGAAGVSLVGQRTIQGYVRVVSPPACSRCVVLAGKEYGWNRGFQRHLPELRLLSRSHDAGRP